MDTECSVSKLQFQGLDGRRVEAEFNGGQITLDAGGLLLREVESRYGFIRGLAACFGDRRDPRFTEFSVEECTLRAWIAIFRKCVCAGSRSRVWWVNSRESLPRSQGFLAVLVQAFERLLTPLFK